MHPQLTSDRNEHPKHLQWLAVQQILPHVLEQQWPCLLPTATQRRVPSWPDEVEPSLGDQIPVEPEVGSSFSMAARMDRSCCASPCLPRASHWTR
jgi:hypothetical protein